MDFFLALVIVFTSLISTSYADSNKNKISRNNYIRVEARNKFQRSALVNLGMSIEAIRSDSVWMLASPQEVQKLRDEGFNIMEGFTMKNDPRKEDFPPGDERFHNYERMTKALDDVVERHQNIMRKFSIGKSLNGLDIWCVQINTSPGALRRSIWSRTVSSKPGAIFLANHHAREHVSAEMALMLLEYLAKYYNVDPEITRLVDERDIYIIPMVNPDGVEYDIKTGKYKWQRKNMRPNGTHSPGVDLNRNYSYKWGTGGSSSDPSSEVYMGPAPFSEPETTAIKNFVESRPNIKVLLSYHTFSELILYPWGHTYDPVQKKEDRDTFEAMARKMAEWNKYRPQQSSDLYIASGDTVDWAYGTLGIFAFTFELSPSSMWGGGFYPGAGILDKVFQDNLKPALYMMELADNPYRAIGRTDFGFMGMEDPKLSWLDSRLDFGNR